MINPLLLGFTVLMVLLALFRITWDMPYQFGLDGDLYTDEGFYSGDAITWWLEGKMYIEGEYNQFIAIPMLQWMQMGAFTILGFGLLTIRLLNWILFCGLLVSTWFLVRRFTSPRWGSLAVALLASNHVMFFMSRYAVAEIPMTFFVTTALALAVYARGRYGLLLAALSAISYTAAVLTKTNAVVLAPILAVVMILVEPTRRAIITKFLLCSFLFLGSLMVYYLAFVRHVWEEFLYFFTLNVGHGAKPWDLEKIFSIMPSIIQRMCFGDPFLIYGFPILLLVVLLSGKVHRGHPLLWMSIGWIALFVYFYSFYGRVYYRFFPLAAPAFALFFVVVLRACWENRNRSFAPLALVVLLLAASLSVNLWKIGGSLLRLENKYNEMAMELREYMDANPEINQVVLGHHSGAVALRTGAIPRHDRYGMTSFEERFRRFQPGYYVNEGYPRISHVDDYFVQREWIERFYELELIGSYNLFRNYLGYPATVFKLTPRESEWGHDGS